MIGVGGLESTLLSQLTCQGKRWHSHREPGCDDALHGDGGVLFALLVWYEVLCAEVRVALTGIFDLTQVSSARVGGPRRGEMKWEGRRKGVCVS